MKTIFAYIKSKKKKKKKKIKTGTVNEKIQKENYRNYSN